MQFGLLYDFRNPPPWQVPYPQLYAETFEQIRAAEALGFDAVWVTEHHFIDDGYLPSCLPAAAAIAAITSRVKIGTCVLLLPLHNALRVAEDAAIVDIISNGRFIFGPGLGYKLDEFEGFGINRKHRRSLMDESLEIIIRSWTEESFSFEGRHYHLKDVRMTPKPVQKPRPPIWLAARAEAPVLRAARVADGIIAVGSPSLIQTYRDAAKEFGKDRSQAAVAVLRSVIMTDDPEKTWTEVKEHVRWRSLNYGAWYSEAGDLPQDRQMRDRAAELDRPEAMRNLIKDPETEIQEVKQLEAMGVDQVIYFATFPGYPPLKLMPTWETLAKQVMPHFRNG